MIESVKLAARCGGDTEKKVDTSWFVYLDSGSVRCG